VARTYLSMTTIIGGMRWHGLLLGLILFKLVVPPLQERVVGLYPVQGVWFTSRLLLVGTVISRFIGHIR
jgi:hypothetical protein